MCNVGTCMYVSNWFTIEVYGFYVGSRTHCNMQTQCNKANDKLGEPDRYPAWSMWKPVEGYCQSTASGTRSKDNWSWTTCGTGLCFYRRQQATHRWCKFSIGSGSLHGSLQVAGHEKMAHINARNLAHDLGVKLGHACVAMLAAPAGEMAGICDTYNYLWWGLYMRY